MTAACACVATSPPPKAKATAQADQSAAPRGRAKPGRPTASGLGPPRPKAARKNTRGALLARPAVQQGFCWFMV
jgi:hypothetical protein